MDSKLKTIALFAALTISIASIGQLKLGPTIGINYSNISLTNKTSNEPTYQNPKPIKGYYLGLQLEVPIKYGFAIRPAFILESKGTHQDLVYGESGQPIFGDWDRRSNFLTIPVEFEYKIKISSIHLFAFGGPSISAAIFGTNSYKNGPKTKLTYGSSASDDYKILDYGLTYGAGIEIAKIQLTYHYYLGMNNTLSNADSCTSKNYSSTIAIAYLFDLQ